MVDEEKSLELSDKDKKTINIWKILFIVFFTIGLTYFACIKIYDSDWYINQTLQIKSISEEPVGKNIKMDYTSKYDGGLLKMNIVFTNIDDKVMDLARKWVSDDENIFEIVFMDKDGFKLTSKPIIYQDLIKNRDNKGTYDVQLALLVDKHTIRKISQIKTSYITAIDMRYNDLIKEVRNRL